MSVLESASTSPASGAPSLSAVDVCICSYNRPAIADTLKSLSLQEGCDGARIRIVVADNAAQPVTRALVDAAARELTLDLTYVHAPANNISIARNACLDAGKADWLAFIDDDEVASPGWLSGLLSEAKSGRWDAVLGPVQAVYSASAPAWVRAGSFHSTKPVIVRGRIETGYTGNVLIRRSAIEGLRFRAELGRSGGEDDDFFDRLRGAGGRIGFAPAALVYETIPADRTTLRWLIRRRFRSGQTHGARLHAKSHSAFARSRALAMATAKAGVCGVATLMHLPLVVRRNRFLIRGALHCGVVARLAGLREINLY